MSQEQTAKSGQSFRISYQKEDELASPAAATSGAYGGVSPDGSSVVMHLYYEFVTVPRSTSHNVSDEGVVDTRQPNSQERDSDLTRVIHSTTIMSPVTARKIGEWLVSQAELAAERSSGEIDADAEHEDNEDSHGDTDD